MKPIKRMEIVIGTVHADRVIEALRSVGVTGYTVINGVSGSGDRGTRRIDGVSGAFENCMVISACDESLVDPAVKKIKPILKRFGGLCLVSDAQWIMH
ncbi:P-II family nitrogen regulator [Algisphaera agarilytica]|uniref:Nitrogen regulatory protein PII n=1 Tax=Algisphaera agarilytica TaxID=1385975 RepID=A0A7X0H3K7_9BACT|nr:transcriptional regulator [Algisphaera agarilytica]MBB6428621.1 nitrogen regulatory protein PII [Algisphaera agarilytica]